MIAASSGFEFQSLLNCLVYMVSLFVALFITWLLSKNNINFFGSVYVCNCVLKYDVVQVIGGL